LERYIKIYDGFYFKELVGILDSNKCFPVNHFIPNFSSPGVKKKYI